MARKLKVNILQLKTQDQVKFLICDRQEYEWEKFKLSEYSLETRVDEILFSASYQDLTSVQLADWIIADNLPVRLQVQLHKILWGDKPGV